MCVCVCGWVGACLSFHNVKCETSTTLLKRNMSKVSAIKNKEKCCYDNVYISLRYKVKLSSIAIYMYTGTVIERYNFNQV